MELNIANFKRTIKHEKKECICSKERKLEKKESKHKRNSMVV